MAKERLERARELVKAKRYDEARAILESMPDNSTALKWLVQLDEIAPAPLEVLNSPPPPSRSGLLIFVLALLLVTLPIALYGAFLRPVGASAEEISSVNSRLETMQTDFSSQIDAVLNESPVVSWKYLVLQYAQFPGSTALTPLEYVTVNRIEYEIQFDMNCDDEKCREENYKGMGYYLDVLGSDGWELAGINNTSGNYYSVEIFFKRPLQAVPNV